MVLPTAAAAAALLAAGSPFDLPSMPRPEEGAGALWDWLRTVNAQWTIPDTEFRWMFGGFSLPVLLLFEVSGMRRTWFVYPFLMPFWLIFGGVALGALGGAGLLAAHVVLFPVGRIGFMLRDRARAREAPAFSQSPSPAPSPAAPAAPAPRSRGEVLRAALDAMRAAAEQHRAGAPGASKDSLQAVLRTLAAGLASAAGASRRAGAAPPHPGPHPAQRGEGGPRTPHPGPHPAQQGDGGAAHRAAPASTPGDLSARFRPDPSRFRRRPPR